MRLATAFAAAALLSVAAPLFAQPGAAPATAVERFKLARDRLADGRLELAAEALQAFLDNKPDDKDYLAIEAKYGPTVFQKLLRVVQWSDNKTVDMGAKKTVDAIIAGSREAGRKAAQDPAQIEKYVRNLGASPAEREFAIDALQPSGAAAVPEIVRQLRASKDLVLKAGIYDALPKLPASTVPGLIAAADPAGDLTADVRASLLKGVTARTDIGLLVEKGESNPTPLLWHYSTGSGQLKETAAALLETLTGGVSGRRTADAELTRLAEPFVTRKGNFSSLDTQTGKVTLNTWEGNGPKASVLDKADAEEHLALKYLRWAVVANPKSEPAQLAFLAVATERAVERAKFLDLRPADPGVYALLAAAPDAHLSALLDQALSESRVPLAVGVLQAMSDRGQKDDARGGTARPSAYAAALAFADARVQFAAAVALLRSPTPPQAGTAARVVEVLRRAVNGDTDAAGGSTGRVLIADPTVARGDRLAAQFRELGFVTEQFASGRQLLRRVAKASDFDLIAVDRHAADPVLNDVLSHLAADPNAARRPVLVVASADKAKPVPVEPLLLRLAALVAATDADAPVVPEPYRYDPKFPPLPKPGQSPEQAREQARWVRIDSRNTALNDAASARLKRIQRLVDAADLPTSKPLTDRLAARLPQFTYAVLAAEFGVDTPSPQPLPSSFEPPRPGGGKPGYVEETPPQPDAFKVLADFTDLIRTQERQNEAVSAVTDTAGLAKIIEQVEGQLTADTRKKFETLLRKTSPAPLLLDISDYRDRRLEAEVARQVKGFKGVAVVAEPLGSEALADDLKASLADPAKRPRTDAEKQAAAKTAVAWLKKIATGEIDGYTITDDAQKSLRDALASDDLAPDALDALAKLGSGDTQVALVRLAANAGRPAVIRGHAADSAARQVQAFGKHTPAEVQTALALAIDDEKKDATLKGKLVVLARLIADKPADLGGGIVAFPVPLRTGAPPKEPEPKDPPKDPKPPEEKK